MKKNNVHARIIKSFLGAAAAMVCVLPACAFAAHDLQSDSWGLANLICMILTILMTVIVHLSRANGRKLKYILMSVMPAAAACIAFAATETVPGPMILADRWTLLMLVIAAVNAVISIVSLRRIPEEEKEDSAAAC
ncbi:MAG: hypothetical protein IJH51_05710 [Christensenellaceae bacterium]|nr:hypothetical protein [Christensenellaceae bacterium]